MSQGPIVTDLKDQSKGVAHIILNRPTVHNALDEQMIEELTQAFATLGQDPLVRVIVLKANGEVFSAGADLNWMKRVAGYSFEKNVADAEKLSHLLDVIDQCPKPTIACIQGSAYGGGVGLICACDIAICSEEATFSLSEVKLGLIPAIIAPYVFKAIGQRQMRRYTLTADRISAEEAVRLGLVHHCVHESELGAVVESLTVSLRKGGPQAMAASKELIRHVVSCPLNEKLRAETARRIALVRTSPEGKEGIEAFLSKRSPSWTIHREET
ncbi:MAG: enoyl-CoA hydratase/isomerase family protein [Alphaproteobacteria bacterium]|nr:enoyl-CoA hydratase/isomerase family protein [Alphaproteobacteria bacterium]